MAQPGGRWSALHQAASAGEEDVVRELLRCRADVGSVTVCGKRPWQVATAAVRCGDLL